jgi:hypothetical protein
MPKDMCKRSDPKKEKKKKLQSGRGRINKNIKTLKSKAKRKPKKLIKNECSQL